MGSHSGSHSGTKKDRMSPDVIPKERNTDIIGKERSKDKNTGRNNKSMSINLYNNGDIYNKSNNSLNCSIVSNRID